MEGGGEGGKTRIHIYRGEFSPKGAEKLIYSTYIFL